MIVFIIGRLSVALGIIVSLVTVSTGLGSKKPLKIVWQILWSHFCEIYQKSNSSYNSSGASPRRIKCKGIQNLPDVSNTQSYATVSGILRTEENFGSYSKGVAKDFDAERFQSFMVAGEVPKFTEEGYNNQVILSDKIANDLHLKPKDSIVAIFF